MILILGITMMHYTNRSNNFYKSFCCLWGYY